MSLAALRINPDGSTTPVTGEEINEKNRYDDYVCNQVINGTPCCAKMVPWFVNSIAKRTYFCSPYGGHLPGCPNDQSAKILYRRYLKRWRKNFSSIDFFKKFSKGEKKSPEGTDPFTKKKGKSPDDIPPKKKESNRPVRRKARDPEYLEYFNALSGAPIDEELADGKVRDYIIDSRTIDYHRLHDLTPARAVIALCRKVPKDNPIYKSVNRSRDQILLMDAFASADNAPPIYFLVTASSGLGYEIISAVLDGKTVALIAPWRKVADNLYASAAPVTSGHVLYFDSAP